MRGVQFMRAIALTAVGMTSAAEANLVITVYDDAGPGQSRWVFSGSAQYSQDYPGGFFAGGDLVSIQQWKGVGTGSDYVQTGAYNNYVTALISGSVTLSVTPIVGSGAQGSIDGLHIDHDTTTPIAGDDFGVSLAGLDIALSDNALVNWSGEAIFAVDVTKLNRGTFSFLDYMEDAAIAGKIYGALPLTLEVVPEPGTVVLMLLGATGLARLRVRRGAD